MLEEPQRLARCGAAMLTTAEAGDTRRQDAVRAGAGPDEPRRGDRLALFPARPECEPAGKAHGPRVIYDIRHVTTYGYESRGQLRPMLAAAGAANGDGQTAGLASRVDDHGRGRADWTARRDFFGNRVTESIVHRSAASPICASTRARGSTCRAQRARPHGVEPGLGERRATLAFEATSLARRRFAGRTSSSRARCVPLLAPVTDYAATSFPPGRPISTARSI